MQSPFWSTTAIIIAYDDSDGWYDHVMGPIVNQSATADDNLNGAGLCGSGTASPYQSRCGYGPRQPLLVISPFAKVNYVDHTVTDQASILRFIEDNWSLGRIGDNSADAYAGTLLNMFKFQNPSAKAVILDPTTGLVAANMQRGAVTKAVANPKGGFTTWIEAELDGTLSTAADRRDAYLFLDAVALLQTGHHHRRQYGDSVRRDEQRTWYLYLHPYRDRFHRQPVERHSVLGTPVAAAGVFS